MRRPQKRTRESLAFVSTKRKKRFKKKKRERASGGNVSFSFSSPSLLSLLSVFRFARGRREPKTAFDTERPFFLSFLSRDASQQRFSLFFSKTVCVACGGHKSLYLLPPSFGVRDFQRFLIITFTTAGGASLVENATSTMRLPQHVNIHQWVPLKINI